MNRVGLNCRCPVYQVVIVIMEQRLVLDIFHNNIHGI